MNVSSQPPNLGGIQPSALHYVVHNNVIFFFSKINPHGTHMKCLNDRRRIRRCTLKADAKLAALVSRIDRVEALHGKVNNSRVCCVRCAGERIWIVKRGEEKGGGRFILLQTSDGTGTSSFHWSGTCERLYSIPPGQRPIFYWFKQNSSLPFRLAKL